MKIPVASQEEVEKVDFVICARKGTPTPFADNVETVCAHCGHAIFHRPYAPKRPPKICIECMLAMETATRQ